LSTVVTKSNIEADAAPIDAGSRYRGTFYIICLALLSYVLLAFQHIKSPGLYYDEALFINAALGAKYHDGFVAYRLLGIPVMTMTYIGALKSALVGPLFKFVGVNIYTIRVPAILLSTLTLVMSYLLLKKFTGPTIAATTILLLSVDPCFVLHTRVDHGPIVLMILLKLSALYFLVGGTLEKSWKSFGVGLLCLVLGLWDKLNFVWCVLAISAAAPFFGKEIFLLIKRDKKPMLICLAIFAVSLGFIYKTLIEPLLSSKPRAHLDFIYRLNETLGGSQNTLNGTAFGNWVLLHSHSWEAICPGVVIVLLVVAYTVCVAILGRKDLTGLHQGAIAFRGMLFFFTILLVIFAEILWTPEAGGPHHYMVLWPFHYFVIACAVAYVVKRGLVHASKVLKAVTLAACFCCYAFNGSVTENSISALANEPKFPLWSESIYDLAEVTEKEAKTANCVLAVDWGLGTQVDALLSATSRKKFRDYWTVFADLKPDSRSEKWLGNFAKNGQILALLYAPNLAHFPENRQHFFQMVANQHLKCVRVSVILDSKEPTYEIYELSKNKDD
jgi:hypothetical protein